MMPRSLRQDSSSSSARPNDSRRYQGGVSHPIRRDVPRLAMRVVRNDHPLLAGYPLSPTSVVSFSVLLGERHRSLLPRHRIRDIEPVRPARSSLYYFGSVDLLSIPDLGENDPQTIRVMEARIQEMNRPGSLLNAPPPRQPAVAEAQAQAAQAQAQAQAQARQEDTRASVAETGGVIEARAPVRGGGAAAAAQMNDRSLRNESAAGSRVPSLPDDTQRLNEAAPTAVDANDNLRQRQRQNQRQNGTMDPQDRDSANFRATGSCLYDARCRNEHELPHEQGITREANQVLNQNIMAALSRVHGTCLTSSETVAPTVASGGVPVQGDNHDQETTYDMHSDNQDSGTLVSDEILLAFN